MNNKKTKILHLLNEIKFSGAETMLNSAARYYNNEKYESVVLSTGDGVGDYAGILEKSGYKIEHIPLQKDFSYLKKLYRFLKANEFDVIHIHAERFNFANAAVCRLSGCKRIFRTVHSVFRFTGLLRTQKIIERFITSKIFSVNYIAISHSVSDVEGRNFKNKTYLVYNWLDESRFMPIEDSPQKKSALRKEFNVPEDSIVLVSVGSCQTIKNHSHIIQAVADLKNEIGNIFYLHIGEGSTLSEEKELAERLGVSGNALFYGQTTRVQEVLYLSDIFMMPSDYEGLPIAGVEALKCKLPIIGYNTYGLRDVVKPGYNGFLTDKDSGELKNSIKKLAADSSLRREFGDNSGKYYEESFGMEKSLNKLFSIYEDIPSK